MSDRTGSETASCGLSMLSAIVLYRESLHASPAFNTLIASTANLQRAKWPAQILVYDNTPQPTDPGHLPETVCYEAPGRNAGLAAAYNRALDMADERGASWLLLLDQDTVLPPDFLESLRGEMERWQSDARVVALVPIVRSRNKVISPKRVGFFTLKPAADRPLGVSEAEIMAVNSGTAVRCNFVRSIGGFNRVYWLDYLDHWLFRRIYKENKRAVVYDCFLEHNLSVQDYRRNIDLARYRSILTGESAFMTSQKPKSQVPFYLLRLAARTARMFAQGQPDLALFTMKTIVKIALHPLRSLEEEEP